MGSTSQPTTSQPCTCTTGNPEGIDGLLHAPDPYCPIDGNATTRVTVAPTFYDDHVDRDLPGGVVVKRTQRGVTVDLTDDDLAELRSDAEFYADSAMEYDRSLAQSARLVVRAIDKALAR